MMMMMIEWEDALGSFDIKIKNTLTIKPACHCNISSRLNDVFANNKFISSSLNFVGSTFLLFDLLFEELLPIFCVNILKSTLNFN
jgi:hypothetical protein